MMMWLCHAIPYMGVIVAVVCGWYPLQFHNHHHARLTVWNSSLFIEHPVLSVLLFILEDSSPKTSSASLEVEELNYNVEGTYHREKQVQDTSGPPYGYCCVFSRDNSLQHMQVTGLQHRPREYYTRSHWSSERSLLAEERDKHEPSQQRRGLLGSPWWP